MKIIFRILMGLGVIFIISKKLYKSPEVTSLKKIYEIHQIGNFEQASILLDEHVEKFPKSSYGWSFKGTVNMQLYNYGKAEIAFQKAFNLDSKNDKAIVGLGVCARNKGDHQLAKQMYEKALQINPRNPEVYTCLLMLEILNKNYSKAVELGEKAKMLNLSDNNHGILANLIVAYHLNDQREERDREYSKLEKTNYREKEYIKMLIDGEIDVEEVFKK